MTPGSDVQNQILSYLRMTTTGGTSQEIASAIRLGQTTVQENLVVLASKGLVNHLDVRGLIGRPKRKYFFSVSDYSQYKTQYSWLSSLLLEELSQSMNADDIQVLLLRIADRVSGDLEGELKNLDERGRLEKLLTVMNELGYQVSLKTSENKNEIVLEAKSCVYHKVAVKHPHLCKFDVRLLENISQKSVDLQCCIARGAKVCRFSLK